MKINRFSMPAIAVIALVLSVLGARMTGDWIVSGRQVPMGDMKASDLKGWMTLQNVSDGLHIPMEALFEIGGIPANADVTPETQLNAIEKIVDGFEVSALREGAAIYLETGEIPAAEPATDAALAAPETTASPDTQPPLTEAAASEPAATEPVPTTGPVPATTAIATPTTTAPAAATTTATATTKPGADAVATPAPTPAAAAATTTKPAVTTTKLPTTIAKAVTTTSHALGTGDGAGTGDGTGDGSGTTPLKPGEVLKADDIKGRMTLAEIAKDAQVPLDALIATIGLDPGTNSSTRVKDLIDSGKIDEIDRIRAAVTKLQGR